MNQVIVRPPPVGAQRLQVVHRTNMKQHQLLQQQQQMTPTTQDSRYANLTPTKRVRSEFQTGWCVMFKSIDLFHDSKLLRLRGNNLRFMYYFSLSVGGG